jgi:hypothetical protein
VQAGGRLISRRSDEGVSIGFGIPCRGAFSRFRTLGNGILPQGIGRFGSERPMTMRPWAHLGHDLAGASDDAQGT